MKHFGEFDIFTDRSVALTVLMGVGETVGNQWGDPRAMTSRADETHGARVLKKAGAGDETCHARSILKYGQSSANFEYR